MRLDWLIIGGGIHGTHLAARLLGEADVVPERIRIIDPADRLLERWRACTATTGMTHLRSTVVHHLDLEPFSLKHFAGKRKKRDPDLFAPPYDRPALSLFNAHCEEVIETFELADLHTQGRATACRIDCDEVAVRLSNGQEIATRNLVLAIGAGEQPEWPEWAPRSHARLHHIFAPGFEAWPSTKETIALIGGGISAAQTALRLLDEGHHVHVVSRHAPRQQQFDSDPGWLGPKYMRGFQREQDLERRRSMITKARNQGSFPPDTWRALRRATRRAEFHWHAGEVAVFDERGSDLRLRLTSGVEILVDRVFLATGFDARRPGGSMVDALIDSAALPCASCGYPVVDTALRWHPRVYVSGPLAELELGPSARNISGARRAGDRLVEAALSQDAESPAFE